ncbi:type IV pilus inner membrane component PilO [Cupriavidus plantarum]|uniref:type 4a pilus biogenesis protein PilO n=1 Tax=Cupriavidus plantarum TaxID=942865 RepID=UPI000E286E6B|nr:type 4a pilus biogenesis protein PilO [Cupriavidus plantarum]NYI00976.1 type IV pilus assembly protein PilO [Cupriavidus plantarum]REE93841.1 type IV pilus assembly protein PilO [Cupriavidus plantarum]
MKIPTYFGDLAAQFRDLDVRDLASWEPAPRAALALCAGAVTFAAGWFLTVGDNMDALRHLEAEHAALRERYRVRAGQAVHLPTLRTRKEEVATRVTAAERQLPSRTDMDALLADINHAGLLRGLQFELFKPEATRIASNFAEIPIRIRVTGRFSDLARFSGDIATMSRIVSMRDLSIQHNKSGGLAMEANVIAYRLLEAGESESQADTAPSTKQGESR